MTAATLPFGATEAELRAALEQVGITLESAAGRAAVWVLWLPTVDGVPVASSPLITDLPTADGPATLAPWAITPLPVAGGTLIELLCASAGQSLLAPGVLVGADLAAWAVALRLAGAIVARQQVLPSVRECDGEYTACWVPVWSSDDRQRLHQLAQALPPAARALTHDPSTPPQVPAQHVLEQFLDQAVDALMRSSAAPPPPMPRPRGRGRPGGPAFASLHEQWMHALQAADGRLTGPPAELAQFAAQVQAWQRPVVEVATAPFRLCFRLEEPPSDPDPETSTNGHALAADADWTVRYLLQASDDPSLLVEAAEVWHARGKAARLLHRGAVAGRQYLLAALGQAAGISPAVAASLRQATPDGVALDTAGAHGFLTAEAPALEQAGFGVLLPAWWTPRGTKRRLTARAVVRSPAQAAGGQLTLDRVLEVDWQVALGDQPLSLEELQALARLKVPLVRLRGQWVEVNADELQAALERWQRQAAATITAGDVVRLALGAGDGLAGGLPIEGVEATGWIADLLAQLESRTPVEPVTPAPGFRGTLRPYQARGLSWLAFLTRWGLGACLADDMGMGKGVTTLALIQRHWTGHDERRPVLLVCPTSVVGNWQREAARFTPDLPVLVHHGSARQRGDDFAAAAGEHALVLSSYALLHRDLELFRRVAWAGVILDEAQQIKNSETKQARAARSLPAGARIALTGTPVENNVGDLWSIMEFLNPGLLGSAAQFRRTFLVPIQAGQDSAALARLKRLTGPFILRRLKTDPAVSADLPDKLEMTVYCTLTAEQASLYQAVVDEVQAALLGLEGTEGMERRGLILATLSKLKQVCNHPAQFLGDGSAIPGRSGKLARLTEMLEEVLAGGERALIFTQFAEMGAILQPYLQATFGREALFLHGGVPKARRDQLVERFQAADGPPLFILSLKAGGTGLTLTRATHVFHFDRWWNPAVENQATDRAYRIGQTRNVQVHKFLCIGTLEERINELIERKRALAEQLVGTGEAWLTELSTAELKELFALRAEAIGGE